MQVIMPSHEERHVNPDPAQGQIIREESQLIPISPRTQAFSPQRVSCSTIVTAASDKRWGEKALV